MSHSDSAYPIILYCHGEHVSTIIQTILFIYYLLNIHINNIKCTYDKFKTVKFRNAVAGTIATALIIYRTYLVTSLTSVNEEKVLI